MSSLIFNSALFDAMRGNINFASDTFKVMFVTAAYVPDKDNHTKRSDVTNEVSGAGYSAGGVEVSVSVIEDTDNDRINVTLGAAHLASSTITARAAVVYKARGGLASADELVAYNDFGADIVSNNGSFDLAESTLRIQN